MAAINQAGIEAVLRCQLKLKAQSMAPPEIDPIVIEGIHLRRAADGIVTSEAELLIKTVMHRGQRYRETNRIRFASKLDELHYNERMAALAASHEHLGHTQCRAMPDCFEPGSFSVEHRQ